MGPKSKDEFVSCQDLMTTSPILPQFFTPVMYFQWEGPNTVVTRPVKLLSCLLICMTRVYVCVCVCVCVYVCVCMCVCFTAVLSGRSQGPPVCLTIDCLITLMITVISA